ncbi:MAG: hypothetical protein FE834_08360 [Gammaproteobacteria bacterium]|nr:hypothetical protein [Gammaproteobacteria bacterium]
MNKSKEIEQVNNSDFLKYLYINSLEHSASINIIKGNYCEYIEKHNLKNAIAILKEYIRLIINTHAKAYFNILNSYINSEDGIEKLKVLIHYLNREKIQTSILSNFLNVYNLNISLKHLKELESKAPDNEDTITALIILLGEKEREFTPNTAISLYQILDLRGVGLSKIKEGGIKIRLIHYLMNVFDTEESIKFVSGIQSDRATCASFLRGEALDQLNLNELKELKEVRKNKTACIWKNRIKHKIIQIEQQDTDQAYSSHSVDDLKRFILSDDIVSDEDFFQDVLIKIRKLKNEIEDNRNNEKESFLNSDGSRKHEEACRDIIIQKLSDKYGDNIQCIKEKHEANNRVDINISQNGYEVQVECKNDYNADIFKGISKQLIGKYLSSQVKYGIYLIFYFGKRKNKDLFMSRIKNTILEKYIKQIEIITIDLQK